MNESKDNNDIKILGELTRQLFGVEPNSIVPMLSHASPRRRFRIQVKERTVIGVLNEFQQENDSFVYLSKVFRASNLPVPEVYTYDQKKGAWLEEDLGNYTLYSFIQQFPEKREALYRKSLEHLIEFQVIGGQKIDFTKCLDRDTSSLAFYEDILRAFKEDFITRVGITFDAKKFESEAHYLISLLNQEPAPYFLYRDFQSRNIMVEDRGLSFIDFQSGRQGHLQYDLVSLLYQVSTHIPETERERLVSHYLECTQKLTSIDPSKFRAELPLYVTARMMQVLSVYGRQGLGLKKEYFLNNISLALPQLQKVINGNPFGVSLPETRNIIEKLMKHFNIS